MRNTNTTGMATWKRAGLAVFIAVTMSACLLEEVRGTWYLEPDGSVTWTVAETDVRSDAQAVADRDAEEATFFTAVGLGNHPIARGFMKLGTTDSIRTRVLRAVVPFSVTTDARFPSIELLGQRLIEKMGLSGSSTLERTADATVWTWSVRDPRAENAASDEDDDMNALASSLDGLRVVLSRGRFIAAKGFTLSPDQRVATLVDLDEQVSKNDNAPLMLQLKWK